MKMVQQTEQELKVQMELTAHEKECAVRYEMVQNKLEHLDKRMWRLEAMIMASTLTLVGATATILTRM